MKADTPFSVFVAELSGGRTNEALTEKLAELAERVRATGRRGSLTFTIAMKPNGDNAVTIVDEIKTKLPEFARPTTAFFVTDGALSRKDPRQRELTFANVKEMKDE